MRPTRRAYLVLIAIAVLGFLAVSAVLARVFNAEGAENAAITELVKVQARGDQAGMVGLIQGCRTSPACRARVALDATALTRPGRVSILELTPSTGFSLGGTLGTARVAWDAGSSLPVVQCVRVRRTGNALSGIRIELLEISPRINSAADCPPRF